MVALTKVRDLDISASADGMRFSYLSAASGLVCINSVMYVVADDEFHLGVFSTASREPGHLLRLFEGQLPEANPARKRQKPDLEALVLLPVFQDFPHGALLAAGSGSRPNRRKGAILGLDPDGVINGPPWRVDLSSILAPLGEEFFEVNIEGAVIVGDELRLFQRGNKRHADNAIIRFPLAMVLESLKRDRAHAVKPSGIIRLDLGMIKGIPLSFTDAAALPGGDVVFSAVAEDTDDAFNDGTCAGAAIGIIDGNGHLRSLQPLDQPCKVEGIHARSDGDRLELLLVTDADNSRVPAALFSATFAM